MYTFSNVPHQGGLAHVVRPARIVSQFTPGGAMPLFVGPGTANGADTYIADPTSKIATEAKHYAAYGFGGRDGSMPAEISDNTLFDVYLKPWRAYAQAGGRGIMAAHNEVSGMPCHGNKKLLTALRETFGFGNGLCASDAGDIGHIEAFGVAVRTRTLNACLPPHFCLACV